LPPLLRHRPDLLLQLRDLNQINARINNTAACNNAHAHGGLAAGVCVCWARTLAASWSARSLEARETERSESSRARRKSMVMGAAAAVESAISALRPHSFSKPRHANAALLLPVAMAPSPAHARSGGERAHRHRAKLRVRSEVE
jgi:hypothetical protein